jgi:hypothetical protein
MHSEIKPLGGNMSKKGSIHDPVIQRLVKSLLPAVIFIFLAIQMTDASSLFRYSAAAAGVAFAVEGLLKFRKDRGKESN